MHPHDGGVADELLAVGMGLALIDLGLEGAADGFRVVEPQLSGAVPARLGYGICLINHLALNVAPQAGQFYRQRSVDLLPLAPELGERHLGQPLHREDSF